MIDATRSIEEQQAEVQTNRIQGPDGHQENEGSQMARFEFFGEGLPEIDLGELKGKLIVLEGTDGVGRSTQIGLLKQWLENHGHAVLDTGMTRSALAGKRLKQPKKGTRWARSP